MRLALPSGRRGILVGLAAAAGALVVATSGVAIAQSQPPRPRPGSRPPGPPPAEPWPPFTMVWGETARGLGMNGATGSQTFRLEYRDRRHFRTTLLENAAVPDAVGSTWTFDGTASIFYDARHKQSQTRPFAPNEETVPAQWLAPERVPPLVQKPGATARALSAGLKVASHEETVSGHRSSREITFREADGIPTRVIDTSDGTEVRRVEVISLEVSKR